MKKIMKYAAKGLALAVLIAVSLRMMFWTAFVVVMMWLSAGGCEKRPRHEVVNHEPTKAVAPVSKVKTNVSPDPTIDDTSNLDSNDFVISVTFLDSDKKIHGPSKAWFMWSAKKEVVDTEFSCMMISRTAHGLGFGSMSSGQTMGIGTFGLASIDFSPNMVYACFLRATPKLSGHKVQSMPIIAPHPFP